MNFFPARRASCALLGSLAGIALACAYGGLARSPAFAQPVDCAALAARIAALGEGQKFSRPNVGADIQRQRSELDRMIRQARGLGCDRPHFFLFDPQPPQCPSLNAQIHQLQSAVAFARPGGDANPAARERLIASYNAYCRNAPPAPAQQAGGNFFEQLFGMFTQNPFFQNPPAEQVLPMPGEDVSPHGGSQALCVRSCDGGFFPLSVSAYRGDPGQLNELCQALCPNAEVSVYTRSPYQDIKTAVSLEGGAPYSELPNAFRYQKTFDAACTCKPPRQSWAEALAPAEQLLGRVSSSDIYVTPEKSAELARPKAAKPGKASPLPAQPPGGDGAKDSPPAAGGPAATEEVTGPDGVKRRVRIIAPPL